MMCQALRGTFKALLNRKPFHVNMTGVRQDGCYSPLLLELLPLPLLGPDALSEFPPPPPPPPRPPPFSVVTGVD